MDDVIDFTALSLGLPDATDTPTAASGMSALLFSTPLSISSGSPGGGRFGSSVGLFYCREINTAESVCGGVIANSGYNRFCLKLNCEVKSHRIQKVKIEVGTLYILGARKEQALLEPSLELESCQRILIRKFLLKVPNQVTIGKPSLPLKLNGKIKYPPWKNAAIPHGKILSHHPSTN
jgi:hypothetical protein